LLGTDQRRWQILAHEVSTRWERKKFSVGTYPETGLKAAGEKAKVVYETANTLEAVYRWAVTHERIEANPMVDLVPSEILKPRHVTHRAAMADKVGRGGAAHRADPER
jgi:hypothetical protein